VIADPLAEICGRAGEPGTLCWAELHTADPAGAKSFYQAVFGWATQDVPMGGLSYTLIRPHGGGEESSFGGMMPLDPQMTAADMTTTWRPYFEVADCDSGRLAGPAASQGSRRRMTGRQPSGTGTSRNPAPRYRSRVPMKR
jgi:predicted enzyme related to lactoylglutathione lyase